MNEIDIVDQIILDIVSEKYEPNEKLPSENDLAYRFCVPRMTVRKAYERLQEMGYIYALQGKGSFVKNRKGQIELVLSGDVSFSEKMKKVDCKFETRNLFCKEIAYNKRIYDFLRIDQSDRVFKIGRLRIIDDTPTALHISLIANSVFQNIDKEGEKITSMFAYYNSQGYDEFYSEKSIVSVSFPTKHERKILHCSHLIPLLVLNSGCIDKKTDTVLEYTKIVYRTDCFKYVINV
ncbi:MAG: GntR family transcriptional regulator [Clostridiales bacterium]|jgi:GntR family transcriptional regulator|nr:GntR family transcriptional regulator [Clostridiales bacterium]